VLPDCGPGTTPPASSVTVTSGQPAPGEVQSPGTRDSRSGWLCQPHLDPLKSATAIPGTLRRGIRTVEVGSLACAAACAVPRPHRRPGSRSRSSRARTRRSGLMRQQPPILLRFPNVRVVATASIVDRMGTTLPWPRAWMEHRLSWRGLPRSDRDRAHRQRRLDEPARAIDRADHDRRCPQRASIPASPRPTRRHESTAWPSSGL